MFPASGYSFLSIPRSSYRYDRDVGNGLGSSVIVAPIRWLQRNFVEPPLRMRRYDGDDLTPMPPTHPLLALLARPNPYYTLATLLKGWVASMELSGNAYWLAALNAQGRPVQLWYVPETMVEPWRDRASTDFIDYYKYQPGDGQSHLIAPMGFDRSQTPGIMPGWAIIHFRDGLDPTNPMKGMSGFNSLLREIFTDDEAANFTASLLRNMGVPGLVVSPADDGGALAPVGEDDVRETKQKFKQATTMDNRGEPIVMTGPTKIETIGFNPQQMNLRDVRRIPEERCSAIIGIPAVVCGLGAGLDRSTFANMKEAKSSAYDDKVLPLQRDFCDTIEHQLLPQFESTPDNFVIDFDNSDVRALRDDDDDMADRVARLVNSGIITVAEGREKLGEPVRDENKVYRVPINLVETPSVDVGMPTIETQAAPGDTANPAESGKQSKEGRVLSSSNAGRLRDAVDVIMQMLTQAGYVDEPDSNGGKSKAAASAALRQRVILALDRNAKASEASFHRTLMKRFAELGNLAADKWRDNPLPDTVDITAPKASDADRANANAADLAAQQLAAADALLQSMNIDAWQSSVLGKDFAGHYEMIAHQTMTTLKEVLGIAVSVPDSVAEQIIREGGRRVGMVYLTDQTRAAVYQAIAEGKAQGLGVDAIERNIRGYVEAGGKNRSVSARAMRIARTETMNAQRMSALATYEGSGAYSTVIAYDNRIGFDDDECSQRDGEEFTFADAEDEAASEHPFGTLSFAPGQAT